MRSNISRSLRCKIFARDVRPRRDFLRLEACYEQIEKEVDILLIYGIATTAPSSKI